MVPLNFALAPAGKASGPHFFAGPYASLLLGGSFYQAPPGQASTTTPVLIANQADSTGSYYARRFDAGVQAGLGFRLEHLVLQAEYSLGVRNLDPTYSFRGVPVTSSSSHNRAFQASVSYLFDFKH